MPQIYLYLLLSTLAIRIDFHRSFMFGCVCIVQAFWMKWFVFLITSSHSSPQCDFLINTFPLAFVCLSLFFFLRRLCSRSSLLLPLLHVLLLSLLCSHFQLFLSSAKLADATRVWGQKSKVRERQAKQRESGRCWKNNKTLLGCLKVQQRSKGGRQGPCDNMKEGGVAGCRYCPYYAKVKDVWRKPAVNIFTTHYCGL